MATSASTNQYRQAAHDKFNSLKQNYPSSFWKLGNSFDTMIDFLDNIDNSSADDVAKTVVEKYRQLLFAPPPGGLGGYDNAWFDDFGWWTIATHRAVEKPFFNQESKTQFRGFMSECWKRFTENAPYVWERRKPGTFDDCRPAVDGGVWNEYWLGTSPNYPGPKGADPTKESLEGIQNTVTNALYLIAAQRLGITDPQAKAAAQREFGFLNTWLFEVERDPLWWPQARPNAALVRERVSHFFNGKDAPGFQTDWAWTGDQGLILGALTDRMNLDRQNLLRSAEQLLVGAQYCLVEDAGMLRNWSASGRIPDGDSSDYGTGAGVFWRYMLHGWKTNPDLRAFISAPEYQGFVRVNADAAMAATNDADPDMLTKDVAVLVAATVMLP